MGLHDAFRPELSRARTITSSPGQRDCEVTAFAWLPQHKGHCTAAVRFERSWYTCPWRVPQPDSARRGIMAARMLSRSHPAPRLGRYTLLRSLGSGGMAELFLARVD